MGLCSASPRNRKFIFETNSKDVHIVVNYLAVCSFNL